MKFWVVLILCCLSVPCGDSVEFEVAVKNPDGLPATDVQVMQIGFLSKGWEKRTAATDKSGQARMSLAEVDLTDNQNPPHYTHTLCSYYRFIVKPDNYPWELSSAYFVKDPSANYYLTGNKPDEFISDSPYDPSRMLILEKHRTVIPISPGERMVWNVRLRQGETKTVSFTDQFNQPVRDFPISYAIDIEASLLNRYGGGMLIAPVVTDRNGNIQIPNAGDFVYQFESSNYSKYYSFDSANRHGQVYAIINGDKPVVRFKKPVGIPLKVLVTDKITGKGIKGVQIFDMVYYPTSLLGGDTVGYTDKNGVLSRKSFCRDHVAQIGARINGYVDLLVDLDQDQPDKTFLFPMEKTK